MFKNALVLQHQGIIMLGGDALKEWIFRCPICKKSLTGDKVAKCPCGHCFDVAKQGHINLLMSNASGKRHGDDSAMVQARSAFLDKGYYAPLRDKIKEILGEGLTLLDSGCGEGYYSSALAVGNRLCGIDISKDAVKVAARRVSSGDFAVASVGDIPLADGSVDGVVCIFAPESDEFARVLKPTGRLITVVPMEKHLIELKKAVYSKPYLNPPVCAEKEGYTLKSGHELKYTIEIDCNEDILALFKMTPYYYKTGKEDQQKLSGLDRLTVSVEFYIGEYEKIHRE